jgi:hypothetical protein
VSLFAAAAAAGGSLLGMSPANAAPVAAAAAPQVADIGCDLCRIPGPNIIELPNGAGTVHFMTQVSGADRVQFFLAEPGKRPEQIGDDSTPQDGFSADYAYRADERLHALLVVVASGPGGTDAGAKILLHS